MKFLRHLVFATAVVAAATGIGVLWGHTSLTSLVADNHGGFDRPPASASASTGTSSNAQQNFDHGPRDGGGGMSNRIQDIGQTLVTEGLIVGGIVVVDKQLKKRRRAKRIRVAA